jgi:hypothetical protein
MQLFRKHPGCLAPFERALIGMIEWILKINSVCAETRHTHNNRDEMPPGRKLWSGHAARRRAPIGSYGPPSSPAIAISGLAIGLDDRKPFHAQ